MTKLMLLMGLVMFQQQEYEGPPPEPPANTPACHNYHDNESQNCKCPKATGNGTHDGHPDVSKGEKWCSTYCLAGKCRCITPMKMVMPFKQ